MNEDEFRILLLNGVDAANDIEAASTFSQIYKRAAKALSLSGFALASSLSQLARAIKPPED